MIPEDFFPVETLLARRGAIDAHDPWFWTVRDSPEHHALFLDWVRSQGIDPDETRRLEFAGDGIRAWRYHRAGDDPKYAIHVTNACPDPPGGSPEWGEVCLVEEMR